MQELFSAAISANLSETPEGYLICHNVPIARTGVQQYKKRELPEGAAAQWPELSPDDVIHVHKTKDELFSPDTISSYNGKAVTDGHPPDLFSVEDHAEYDCGHVMNARAGTQQESDGEWYLYADLMLQEPSLISAVQGGYKRQVSCGAFNTTVRRPDGDGEQIDNRGNHVAVVPKGRAGTFAGIRDHQEHEPKTEMKSMADTLKNLLGLGIREHAKTAQPEELAGLLSLGLNTRRGGTRDADDDTPDETKTLKDRIAALEAQIAEMEGKTGTQDAKGTKDAKGAKDEDKKEDKKDDDKEGTEDEGEITLPLEDQPKDAIATINAAGSMDSLMGLRSSVAAHKSIDVKSAWNKRYRSFKGAGTQDGYEKFNAAAATKDSTAQTHDELVAKAQASYDAARTGKK